MPNPAYNLVIEAQQIATDSTLTANLGWTTGYPNPGEVAVINQEWLDLATDPGFSNIIFRERTSTYGSMFQVGEAVAISELPAGIQLYWRINELWDLVGGSYWYPSSTISLRILAPEPGGGPPGIIITPISPPPVAVQQQPPPTSPPPNSTSIPPPPSPPPVVSSGIPWLLISALAALAYVATREKSGAKT